MDTSKLKTFAQGARRQLLEQVGARLEQVLRTDSAELRERGKAVEALQAQIRRSSKDVVVDRVAYTWFNRFCALRYMDVNHYTRVGIVSPAEGHTQPEILFEAKQGVIDEDWQLDRERVLGLLNGQIPSGNPQQEAYRLLLVGACNAFHKQMPFLFPEIDDYTGLLMPDDLLSENAVLHGVREVLTEETCRDVEVIGWLYQYYISERKDEVIGSKAKIRTEDIPAATQLFTPHWIVRYLVENSLGRLWMLNFPDSKLVEQMDYFIAEEESSDEEVGSSQLLVLSKSKNGSVDDTDSVAEKNALPDSERKANNNQLPTNNYELSTNNYKLKTTNFLRVSSPEELLICDPACGSGHMLTYGFDLLYAIYAEQGYDPVEIPRLILEKNLVGIEIDERAGDLAAFALMMKAREKDRRFFSRGAEPNIVVLEDLRFTAEELQRYQKAVGPELYTQELWELLQQFEDAQTYGSLIRPVVKEPGGLREKLEAVGPFGDLFLQVTHKKVLDALRYAEALSPRYHVVVANPPYMGGRGMNDRLKGFLKDQYEDVKSDTFSAFIVRNLELALPNGQLGFMSPFVWMFISSYEKLREYLIQQKTITSLIQLEYSGFEGATVPICTFTLENDYKPQHEGAYIRLSDFRGAANQAPRTLEAIRDPGCGWFYRVRASEFGKIPGSPIAYWVSERVREVFKQGKLLQEIAEVKQGLATADNDRFVREWFEVSLRNISFTSPRLLSSMADACAGLQTGDNSRFVRFWFEVPIRAIGFDSKSQVEANEGGKKWFPYNKGGEYRRWFGNREHLVNWQNDGYEIRNFIDSKGKLRSRPQNAQYYFRQSITWSFVSSSYFGVRYSPPGALFDVGGSSLFPQDADIYWLTGFMCSKLSTLFMKAMNPTLNFQVGDVASLPIIQPNNIEDVSKRAMKLIVMSQFDWDTYETSWEFDYFPVLSQEKGFVSNSLSESYVSTRSLWQQMTDEMQRLEEENNRIFIETYDLQDELTPEVPLPEITLTCNPHYRYDSNKSEAELEALLKADTMRELISYAVGCMFGRYSLDKPGLVLANAGETLEDYLRQVPEPTFLPDEDNVVPLLEGEWFEDDIAERFKQFLKATFGEEHFAENLAFLEDAIGRDIRSYFLRDFYDQHVKMYKKRPIYWLFSSPKGSFNALVYLHRYRPDTVSVVLNEYLLPYRHKLTAHKAQLEARSVSASASQSEKTRALKEIDGIQKILSELKAYEDEVLYPLAAQQLAIDLDDGVLVNYQKFGKALKSVKGMSE